MGFGLIGDAIGNAKLQGLTTQLELTGNKYNIALVRIFPSRLFGGERY